MPITSMRKYPHQSKGFTLIELMIALAIFSIIGALLATIFTGSIMFYGEENSQLSRQEAITAISVAIEKDIRSTNSMSVSGTCLSMVQTSKTISYCFDGTNHQVKRDLVVIAKDVASISFLVNLNELSISIGTTSDRRGEINNGTLHYYLRQGNY